MKKIAIIGRENVGKSTLFNKLCQKELSIVNNQPGVTRDYIKHIVFMTYILIKELSKEYN